MKTWIMCLAFNRPQLAIDAVKRCKLENDLQGIEHEFLMVDPGYPLPDKKENGKKLAIGAKIFGYTYLRTYKNRGVAANWMWAINEVEAKDEDIFYGIDADAHLQHRNFIAAAIEVFKNDPTVFYIGANRPPFFEKYRRKEYQIGSITVYEYQELIAWSVGFFHVGNIRKMGGIQQTHSLYGGIEQAMFTRGNQLGLKAVFLKDYHDHHASAPDPEYTEWKRLSATTPLKEDFETWLEKKS